MPSVNVKNTVKRRNMGAGKAMATRERNEWENGLLFPEISCQV